MSRRVTRADSRPTRPEGGSGRLTNLVVSLPLAIAAALVFVGLLGFVVIDVLDVADSREWVRDRLAPHVLFFLWYFGEAGPIEHVQWTFLGVAACLAGELLRSKWDDTRPLPKLAAFAGFVGLCLMFLEDMLNLRHLLSFHVTMPLFAPEFDLRSPVRTVTEISFYGLLGGVMVTWLVGLRAVWSGGRLPRVLIFLGFGAYGVASVASATRYIGNWYERIGDAWVAAIEPGIALWYTEHASEQVYSVGFWFMDSALEEAVELAGAAAILGLILFLSLSSRGRSRRGSEVEA